MRTAGLCCTKQGRQEVEAALPDRRGVGKKKGNAPSEQGVALFPVFQGVR